MKKLIERAKFVVKGEQGMPTVEAVGLIAVAGVLYVVFTVFGDQIRTLMTNIGTFVAGWTFR